MNVCGNPTTRRDLEKLPLEDFNSILILADQDFEREVESHDMMHADSRSLTSLLLIRDIQNGRNVTTLQEGRISIFDPNFTEENRRMVSPASTPEATTEVPPSDPHDIVPIEEEEDAEGTAESTSVAVISEILDVRTKPLISVASVTDYVTSNELVPSSVLVLLIPPIYSSVWPLQWWQSKERSTIFSRSCSQVMGMRCAFSSPLPWPTGDPV